MTYCRECGKQIGPSDEFCKKCGAKTETKTSEARVKGPPEKAKSFNTAIKRGSQKRAAQPAMSPASKAAGIIIGLIIFVAVLLFIFVAMLSPLFDLDLSNMQEKPSSSAGIASPGESSGSSGCSAGSAPAIGDLQKCCKTSNPYYWSSDNKCHTAQAATNCQAGSAPAIGDPQKCCKTTYPYYWSSDGQCHTAQKCSAGSAPAIGDPQKCCKTAYPYYWSSDGQCHTTQAATGPSSNADIIARAKTLVSEYQTAYANNEWDIVISVGQELEAYIETYDDILVYDIYFEENLDGLIEMIDNNKVEFQEVCRNGGSYTACTTPISDTATLSCEEAEQRFSRDYSSIPPESLTLSQIRSQIGQIDDALSRCANIRPSEQIDDWNSARSQLYAVLTQAEQACNSLGANRPPICN